MNVRGEQNDSRNEFDTRCRLFFLTSNFLAACTILHGVNDDLSSSMKLVHDRPRGEEEKSFRRVTSSVHRDVDGGDFQ